MRILTDNFIKRFDNIINLHPALPGKFPGAHAISEALQKFRVTDGWELGADAEVVFRDKGYSIGVSSKTISKPVYAVVFDQRGLLAGTSLVGAKYSRLIR